MLVEEKIAPIIIIALLILLLVILGIVFIKGKSSSLIAGYNTMPREEKKEYNTELLLKFIGKMMFALSFSMLLWIISILYDMISLFIIGAIFFISMTLFTVIYVNVGDKFKNKNEQYK